MAQSSVSKGPRTQVKSKSAKENQTQPANSLTKSLNSKVTQPTVKNVKGSQLLQASQAQDVDTAGRAALLKKVAIQQG